MSYYNRTEVCAHLRSKQLYSPSDTAHRAQSTSSRTEVFWCSRTMSSTGPDEVLCDVDTCCPGRWCYRSVLDV